MSDKAPPQRGGAETTGNRIKADTPLPTAREGRERDTGVGTAPPALDVADPHPSDEEHPYEAPDPRNAGAPPPDTAVGNDNIGPNPSRHDGTAPPRPHNRGSGPA